MRASRSWISARLQPRYWFHCGAIQLIEFVLHKCVRCTRIKGATDSQIMGNLPKERVTIACPFSFRGIDFAGHFFVECTRHRSTKFIKYYAAFFMCLTIRAVLIEAVSDLKTTIAFIAFLQRFTARRGIPNTIWTDNGTNFVSAGTTLFTNRDKLEEHASQVLSSRWSLGISSKSRQGFPT